MAGSVGSEMNRRRSKNAAKDAFTVGSAQQVLGCYIQRISTDSFQPQWRTIPKQNFLGTHG